MRKVIKEGTIVKVKRGLESLRDTNGRIGQLYCDTNMYQYEGQELKVSNSWWNYTGECYFSLEGAGSWTWNLKMIEEVSEENMKDLDRVCSDCGRELEEDEELIYIEEYDKYVCQECFEEHYVECEDCGRIVHEDDIHNVEGGDRSVCDSCFDNYYYCADCGEYYYSDNMYYDEDTDEYYCEDCWNSRPTNRVMGYSEEHNDPNFIERRVEGEEEGIRLYGTETEVENYDNDYSMIDVLYEKLPVRLARDGSLNESNSYEIITDPCSMKFHKQQLEVVKDVYQEMIDKGYRSDKTSTCGLHVHATRPYQAEIDRLNKELWSLDCGSEKYKELQKQKEELEDKQEDFINRIILVMETFKEPLINFSRRKDTYWCKWLSDVVSCDNGKITSIDFIKKVKGESYGHHRALNLENHNTIEFRIFKGTLNYETYYATLELVDNIMNLCGDLDLPVEKITWDKLTRGEYVSKYVQERGIVCNYRVVDTSEIDRIWEIVKNKKKGKVAKKIYNLLNKYYNEYVNKFNEVKNSEKWALICDITSKLREHSNNMERVLEYKNNNEYASMFSKVQEMIDYYMYFDTDTLKAIRTNIRELLNEVR